MRQKYYTCFLYTMSRIKINKSYAEKQYSVSHNEEIIVNRSRTTEDKITGISRQLKKKKTFFNLQKKIDIKG